MTKTFCDRCGKAVTVQFCELTFTEDGGNINSKWNAELCKSCLRAIERLLKQNCKPEAETVAR